MKLYASRNRELSRGATNAVAFQDQNIRERVWGFLLENRDAHVAGELVVDSIRQEEIATRVGLPLHEVIEAIEFLNREGRLHVERQPVGRPNRYLLRDKAQHPDAIAI